MNNILQTKVINCINCETSHKLSECAQRQVITPTLSWPDNLGSTNIEFTCPNCNEIIYTHKIR